MFQIKNYEKLQTKEGNTCFVLYLFSDSQDSYKEAKKYCEKKATELDIDKSKVSFKLSWNKSFADVAPYDEERNRLWSTLVDFLRDKKPSVAGVITSPAATHKITGEGIAVTVPTGMFDIVARTGVCGLIEDFLRTLYIDDEYGFGKTGGARFVVNEENGEKKRSFGAIYDTSDAQEISVDFNEEEYKKATEEFISNNKKNKKSKKQGSDNYNGKFILEAGARHKDTYRGSDGKRKRRLAPEDGKELPKDSKGNEIIIGGEIMAEAIPMIRITSDIGYIAVKGRVFSFEQKTIPSGSCIAIFNMTDETFSLTCKFFYEPEDEPFVKKYFGEGKFVEVYGDIQLDKYTHETTMMVRNAVTYKPPKRMDRCEKKRVELHLHTMMSQLDAITRPGKLIKRLNEWGHTAVAITDHGGVQGFPDVFNAVAKEKSDIKIIYGMECYLTDQPGEVTKEEAKGIPSWHCILLVKNLVGLRNLYELISDSNLKYFYKKPRIPRFELEKHREGLIIGSACSEGELFHALVHGADDEKLREMASFYDYLEIQPTGNNKYLIREGVVASERDLQRANEKIVEIADSLGKMTVATCDVHFLDPEDAIYRCVMQAGQGYKDAQEQPPIYLRTTEEMLQEFAYLGDRAYEIVVENTNKIADQIEKIRPVPAGTFFPEIEGAEEEFRAICYERAKATYGDPVPAHIMERLNKELNPIIANGYAVMYMAAQKLVAHSAENGYTVGSRGSVGSSIAAYMAGITEVNALQPHYRCPKCFNQEFFFNQEYEAGIDMPPKDCPNCGTPMIRDGFDIPFETFLGFNADKTPDIDLNFATKDQPSAHKYCGVLFGDDHVFRAGTISGLAEKTARGYVLKYLESVGKTVPDAEIQRLASGFIDVKRTTGQHPGGIIVVPKDRNILEFTPVQHPADDADSTTVTTHFDYHFLHETILKLDILGHDGPEIIKCLEDFTGITMDKVDIADPGMLSLFTSPEALRLDESILPIEIETGTLGIPEFGTHFAIGMLKATKPTTFSELVRISGLSHGTNVWQGNASDIIEKKIATLKECICCRDDIMLYLIKMGVEKKTAFDIMESVRKGKVAKKAEGRWPEWKKMLQEHNVPDWYIESCEKIEYMFPRAHAVAYVMLSTRMAWFKLYQPLAYYSTRFTLKVDDFDGINMLHGIDKAWQAMKDLQVIPKKTSKEEDQLTIYEQLMEMYARHIEFLPIDLYKSEATRFVPEDGKLRPPFSSLAGVGTNAAEAIVKAREDGKGEFESIEDVVDRSGINKSVVETLKQDGVFAGMREKQEITLFDV